jgi:hypothetical protein
MSDLSRSILQRSNSHEVRERAAILSVIGRDHVDLLFSLEETRYCFVQSIVVGIGTLEDGRVLADDFAFCEATEVLPGLDANMILSDVS